MNVLRRMTIPYWIAGLTGVAGFLIGLLDFIGAINWAPDTITRIILVGVGLLMVNGVVQGVQQENTIEELSKNLAGPRVKFLKMRDEVPREFLIRVTTTEQFMRMAILGWMQGGDQRPRDSVRNRRDEQIRRRGMNLLQLMIIRHRQHFEEALCMSARFGETHFYGARYLPTPPKSIPFIDLWSFDDKHLFLGPKYPPDFGETNYEVLYTQDERMIGWYKQYWDSLWIAAHGNILAENTQINLTAFYEVAKSLQPPINKNEVDHMWKAAQANAKDGVWENGKLESG